MSDNGEEVLVLVEPYAFRRGGHHQHALLALAQARGGTVVIAPNGVARDTLNALHQAGARLVTGAAGLPARAFLWAAGFLAHLSWVGQRLFRSRWWPRAVRRSPHQVTLLARCLVEAAALRTGGRQVSGPRAVVVLTASEGLHGVAALLGGVSHLRFVHETSTTEGTCLRMLARLARRAERRVFVLCPTPAVHDQMVSLFPRVVCRVRVFAVDDGRRLTEHEHDGGRLAFDIPGSETVVCLVGGWWPHKDIAVVDQALGLLTEPLHVIVTGHPLDEDVLARWADLKQVRLHVEPGPLSEAVLRLVYGASDATLVARHAGVGKESGLVMDAAQWGVPLIVSDHDPHLTARLGDAPWVRLFTAGDPRALAAVLDDLVRLPLPPPGHRAPARLGMPTAAEQADFLIDTAARLTAGKEDG
ncbi:hypothetical protein [Streptomyces sp. NPDC048057]|uniref:hypothetical protein n=1 Tax=Streptomyces sp. NPDC048057 TaxID=3155628 RepID=UPI0033C3A47D